MIKNLAFIGTLLLASPANAILTAGSEREVTLRTADVHLFYQANARIEGNLAIWTHRIANNQYEVLGAFVTTSGERAGNPFRIGTTTIPSHPLPVGATPPTLSHPPAVAFGGGRYLVVFEDGRGRFVDADGTMSDEIEVASNARELHVAFNGNVFLVTWLDPDRLVYRGSIVGSGLQFDIMLADRHFVPGSTNESHNVIAGIAALNGAFYAITTFVDVNSTPVSDGYAAKVRAVPIAVDGTTGPPIEIAPATTPVLDLRASSSANDIRVAWTTASHTGEIRTSLVFRGGLESFSAPGLRMQALSGDVLIYGDEQKHFVRRAGGVEHELAAPATKAVVDDASGEILIFRTLPAPDESALYIGRIDGPFTPLVLSPHPQGSPDIAASASGVRLAVWSEFIGKDGRNAVMASRIDSTGASLDAAGIDLGASTYNFADPRVASNGTDWLVAWKDRDSVYASRVSQSGQLLDSNPILIRQTTFTDERLSVVWDGYSYVLAYVNGYFFHGYHFTATVVRVSADGQMLKEIALTEPGEIPWTSIAAGAGGSLVVWGLGGAILSRNDTITPVALASSPYRSIAWNGHDFLVTIGFDRTLRWQLVSDTGVVRTVLTPFVVDAWSVEATAFGDGFLFYWWYDGDLFGVFMNDRGALVDAPLKIPEVSVPFRPDGNMIIYARTVSDTVPGVSRVFARVIEGLPAMPRRRAVR